MKPIAAIAALLMAPGVHAAFYLPVGPQTNVARSTITGGGWTQCYSAPMSAAIGVNAENVLSVCSGNYLMMAGRRTGSSTFLVVAAAPFADATFNTGGGSNTHLANGSNWYFTPNWSWGFTAANDTVNLSQCDVGGSSATSICLHTLNVGGYRINDISSLNDSNDYEKVFFVAVGGPAAYDDTATTKPSTPVGIDVMANDSDFGSPVTVGISTAPQNGMAVVNGSPGDPSVVSVTYTPAAGFQGVDTFQYSVSDGAAADVATVTVTVSNPQANSDSAETRLGTPIAIDVLANDVAFSDPVTVTLVGDPSHGTAVVTGSPGIASAIRITYTPAAGYSGGDSLQYQVSDGVDSASATVAITVLAFKAVDDHYTILSNSDAYLYAATNDVGFQDPVTLNILAYPSVGSAHVDGSPGSKSNVLIHYFPNYGSTYTTEITYSVSDGIHTDTATATIHVVEFMAQDDVATTGAGNPITINVVQNDLGFNYPRTVGIFTNPLHGAVTVQSTGYYYDDPTISYAPDAGFTGEDTFQYAIDDGNRIGTATVRIHVINDADNDLVNDMTDNCLGTSNISQLDTDGDGYGNACDADVNNNGIVNFSDLGVFRARFATHDPDCDLDGNGVVNFADLARLRTLFGRPPGPSALHPPQQ